MCQMCEEADRYIAQLEAAERKVADAKARGGDQKTVRAEGKPDEAATARAAK